MLTDDGKHLYVSWDAYHRLIEKLAIQVWQSGWEFDQILCLARGGMRPGDVLSRVFDKPLAIMPTITELKSAVIWTKAVSSYEPDYYVEKLPTSPWIHQPFEEYDDMRPPALHQKMGER